MSLVEALVARLHEWVLQDRLPGGTAITEKFVSDEFYVSRVTAQKAINAMVSRNIFQQEPNKAAMVPVINDEDVRDIFQVRIPLELEAVRMLMKRGELSEAAHSAALEIAECQDIHVFSEIDLRFHRELVRSSGSVRLFRSWQSLEWEIQLAMVQAKRELRGPEVSHQHVLIEESIGAGDWPEARATMLRHLRKARDELAEKLGQP